ncbi:MAG: hypothetical protein QW705_00180 [Zestosphaera sp.]
MNVTANPLINAFREVLKDVEMDYRESSHDSTSQLEWEIYRRAYRLIELNKTDTTRKDILFIDSGFRTYETDVCNVTYIQLGGLYRDVEGNLKPMVRGRDALILSVSRVRSGDGYDVRARVKGIDSRVLLGRPDEEFVAGQELTRLIRKIRPRISKDYRAYRRFSRYLTALIELSYALKLYDVLRQERSLNPLIVIDGTLMRWFAVRRRGGTVDGVDVLTALTGLDETTVLKYLTNVVGLSKSSKTTNLLRVRKLVREKGYDELSEVYGIFDWNGLREAVDLMGDRDVDEGVEGTLKEHVRIYNRMVYHVRGVWVVRAPVVTVGLNVYMVDVHSMKPVIDFNSDSLIVDKDALNNVNERLAEAIPSVFAFRSRLVGVPPYGFMEVDQAVRVGGDEARAIDVAFIKAISESGGTDVAWAFALISSSVLRRYGYRWGV